jgi:hypothetical protein
MRIRNKQVVQVTKKGRENADITCLLQREA